MSHRIDYTRRRVASSFKGNSAPISSIRRHSMSQIDLFSSIIDSDNNLYIRSGNGTYTTALTQTVWHCGSLQKTACLFTQSVDKAIITLSQINV